MNRFCRAPLRRSLVVLCLAALWSGQAAAADPLQGQRLYGAHCANCHGARGAGQIPGVPDFSRGERLLQPDRDLVVKIKRGVGMMPGYQALLDDGEILDVIAHLRTLR